MRSESTSKMTVVKDLVSLCICADSSDPPLLDNAIRTKIPCFVGLINILSGLTKTPSIAFNVREAVDQSPSAGQIMLFKTIVLNTGNAYDARTGIFTSPVNGTYIFHVQICTNFRENGSVKIVSGDTVLLGISNYNYISGITGTSGSAAHILAEGQMVWVVNEYDSASAVNLIDSDHERACWNQFSGVLVELNVDH